MSSTYRRRSFVAPLVNPKNKLESQLAYRFNDAKLLKQALTHRSFSSENNERLEFLGDALLGAISAQYLYRYFSEEKEGKLSRLRSALVKGETLAEIANEFSLGDHLIMGEGERKSGGYNRPSILADALEAIIGAIYLDSDFATTQTVVEAWLSSRFEALAANKLLTKDHKTQLQEWLQARKHSLPIYTIVNIDGADHEQWFTVSCELDLLPAPVLAEAGSRRDAEKLAAKKALDFLRE